MTRPSRRTTKWLLGLITFAAVAGALWLLLFPGRGSPRLFIGEPRVTDTFAYFPLTNRHAHPVRFYFIAEKKTATGWPLSIVPVGAPLSDASPATMAGPGQTSLVRVLVPTARVPWRLRIVYWETETLRERFLEKYGAAMEDARLGTLANRIANEQPHEIFGREMSPW